MAINDWNGDGKIDSFDDYAEYEGLYHSDVGGGLNQYHGNYSSGHKSGGMSTLGAILCTISGLVEQAILYTALGIEVDNVPAIVLVILWIVFSSITAAVVSAIKR